MSTKIKEIPAYDQFPLTPISAGGTGFSDLTPVTPDGLTGVVDHLFINNVSTGAITVKLQLVNAIAGMTLPNAATTEVVAEEQVGGSTTVDLANFRDAITVPKGSKLQASSTVAASLDAHGKIHYELGSF